MSTIYSADTRIGRNVSYFMKLLTQAGPMCTLVKAYFWLTFPVGCFFHDTVSHTTDSAFHKFLLHASPHMSNTHGKC